MHAWDPLTPIEETLAFLDDAVRAGKIRYVGLSNFTGWQLQRAVDLTERHGWARAGDACSRSTTCSSATSSTSCVPVCAANEGIGILPWSPLGGGWLTGKYQRDAVPTGDSRLGDDPERGMEAYAPRNAQERTWQVLDAVGAVAEEQGVAMSRVALAWLADRPAVTSVILGARTLEQLEDNLGAADLHLSAEQAARLDEASAPVVSDYPYGEAGVDQRSRVLP